MPTLIVLIGPTGVGKTELSLRLAENFHTCIVSADSRQLYAELKIGTAAPTPDQLKRVPHYLVGTLHLTDYYSAAQYEQEAMEILHQLFTEHEVVVLTGGSMMYVDAICKGIDDIPTVDAETRQVMLQKYEEEGLEQLCAELRLLDPDYYRIVDLKNPKRVIHALEICYMTGKTYTSFRTQQKKERPFRILKIGLTRDREELYDRINRRVDQMMEEGLLDEVRSVLSYRHLNSLNTVGYKELFKYLDGECKRYADLLTQYPPDIVCLGIGENGHIAFNDPDVADFNDPELVKIVKLDPICRQQQVNEKCFETLDLVPKEALTLTIPALLKAEWMFCIVPFKNKAHAVYQTVYGEISEKCPASILRRKEKSSLYLDAESAELINL